MVKENLLIIEDDPDIVELMQYNLEREGYRVLRAEDVGWREAPAGLMIAHRDARARRFTPCSVSYVER